MRNKNQHVIPNCYLKSWCDPRSLGDQNPHIWRVRRDGSQKRRKSPEKSFRANNRYTITMPNGDRNLVIENTLGGIENQFVNVLGRIRRREYLTPRDRAHLCLFTAAMHARADAVGEHWKKFYQSVHSQVVALEKKHNSTPTTSLESADMVKHAYPYTVDLSVEVLAPMLFRMPMTILVTDDALGFITSDNPCVWFVPNAHTMPPMLRHPSLSQPDIEISLPLTPQHLLLIAHRAYPQYVDARKATVDEANRSRRFNCTEEFVSWKGGTLPYWFDPGKEPDDTWEKSPEGMAALAEQERYKKWQVEYQEATNSRDETGDRRDASRLSPSSPGIEMTVANVWDADKTIVRTDDSCACRE
jgi:uncharacterized protein DUF4238